MITPSLKCDFYKLIHKSYYPAGVTKVWAYFTPRQSRIPGINYVIPFGVQAMWLELVDNFKEDFFNIDWEIIEHEMKSIINATFMTSYDLSHFKELHKLGELPIEVRILVNEGEKCPIGCPMLEITNTHDDFAWLVNFLETWMSTMLWHPTTSATIAFRYREILEKYASKEELSGFEKMNLIGDFSMRGQTSLESATKSSAAFMTCFNKTSNIPAIKWLGDNYNASYRDCGQGGISTEHSIMCLLGQDEVASIQHILDNTKDGATISIVSDTWDYWNMITNIFPQFKEQLIKRNIKILIRPDSGDPVKIVAGYNIIYYTDLEDMGYTKEDLEKNKYLIFDIAQDIIDGEVCDPEYECVEIDGRYFIADGVHEYEDTWLYDSVKEITKEEALGSIEILYEKFGGYTAKNGFKCLHNNIGLIYGDSITHERASMIYFLLQNKKFSITNVTLCSGSFSLQYVTRDTFGFAQKITAAIVNGEFTPVFKDPKTSDSTQKKSHKGIVRVTKDLLTGNYIWEDGLKFDINRDKPTPFFNAVSLDDIRRNILEQL